MPVSLGSELGSVARMIRSDQDSLTRLLQQGLVVLVSVGRAKVMGERGGRRLAPEPPSHSFSSRAPRRARRQTRRRCSLASS